MAGFTDGLAARDAAAEPARARINFDLERAGVAVARGLHYLREHLFDPDLSIRKLQKETRNTDSLFFHGFRDATGESPKPYIEALRLETAAALLRDTERAVNDVASVCGFVSLKTFRLRFRARFGLLPGRYAKEHATVASAAGEDAIWIEAPEWLATFAAWEKAERLERQSRRLGDLELAASGRRRAEQAWMVARELTERARRQLVIFVGRTTPALAELLFERSRIEGRGNRDWGVAIAELARAAIPPHTNLEWPGARLHETRLRAHAWIGNAHRLRLDLSAAAAAFAEARRELEASGEAISALARAELPWLEAGLYWVQSDYERAGALADEAVAISEAEEARSLLVPALRRRASVTSDAGRHADSLKDLERCVDLTSSCTPAAEVWPIHQALAGCYLALKDVETAARELAIAETLCALSDDSRAEAHVSLTRGRLNWLRGDQGAASRDLERALRGFEGLDSRFEIEVAKQDLRIVHQRPRWTS